MLANQEEIDRVAGWLTVAQRIVVFTGAGISTDSGIPDFRGPNGVWTKNPQAERMSTIQHYIGDPEVRRVAWQTRVHSPNWKAEPNGGHRAIVTIQNAGRLHALVTQNIDELHQISGVDRGLVVEVHGTMRWSRCWECQDRRPMQETLDRVRAGDPDPECELCGGILKSDTISFGQALVPEVINRAMQAAQECDVLLAIGSTLSVSPANNVVSRAKSAGAKVVIINGEPTARDGYADALLIGDITSTVRAIVVGAGFLT